MAQRFKIKNGASFVISSVPIIIMMEEKGMSRRYHGIGFTLCPCLISMASHIFFLNLFVQCFFHQLILKNKKWRPLNRGNVRISLLIQKKSIFIHEQRVARHARLKLKSFRHLFKALTSQILFIKKQLRVCCTFRSTWENVYLGPCAEMQPAMSNALQRDVLLSVFGSVFVTVKTD